MRRIVGVPDVLRAVGRDGRADEVEGLLQRQMGVLYHFHRQCACVFVVIEVGTERRSLLSDAALFRPLR